MDMKDLSAESLKEKNLLLVSTKGIQRFNGAKYSIRYSRAIFRRRGAKIHR